MSNTELKQTRDSLKRVAKTTRALTRRNAKELHELERVYTRESRKVEQAFRVQLRALDAESKRLDARLATLLGRSAK